MSTITIQKLKKPLIFEDEIQSKHRLTFAEICPLWNEKIETGNMGYEYKLIGGQMFVPLNLASPKHCVVGEAHKFNDFGCDSGNNSGMYGCKDCQKFSSELFNTSVTSLDGNRHYRDTPEFEKTKDLFVAHWNNKHI